MNKRITQFRWLAAKLLLVAAMAMPSVAWAEEITPTQPSVGDGSTENPYQISSAAELYWFAALINGDKSVSEITIAKPESCAKLMNDITVNEGVLDASGNLNSGNQFIVWTPIGNSKPYSGTFDGQGHTVSGLYLDNTETDNVGLFGSNDGTIQNVGVVDSYFNGRDCVGGVCGMNWHDGTEIMYVTITNCYNTGVVNGRRFVGGVCGYNRISTGDDGKQALITDCYNTGKVSGNNYVGGVCGRNYANPIDDGNSSASIMNCYNTGAVSGNNYVGGVCGENSYYIYMGTPSAAIMNCYYNSDNYTGDAVGNNTGDVVDVMGKNTAHFASGEVCYLLSQGSTVVDDETSTSNYYSGAVWGQQLGVDNYPLASDYKVIRAAQDGMEGTDYWATFSNQTSDADLGGLTVYKAKVNAGKMTLSECDNTVAKGEGVLVKGSSEYLNAKLLNTATEVTEPDNDLVATPETAQIVTADDDYTLYRLTYNDVNNKEAIGFYLSLVKDENGDVIESSVGKQLKATTGKAYLNVPTSESKLPASAAPARGFGFPGDDGETTGIECITVTDESLHRNGYAEGFFDLLGRKVSKPTKGLYINNGKKVIIK